jgi:hypothetical protein
MVLKYYTTQTNKLIDILVSEPKFSASVTQKGKIGHVVKPVHSINPFMALQPFVGHWPFFQFLDLLHRTTQTQYTRTKISMT